MSIQNFKDANALFSQIDHRWSAATLGRSGCAIGKYGCTVTAICRMFFVLFKVQIRPDRMAQLLDFTKDGKVYWSSVVKAAERMGFKLRFNGRVKEESPDFYTLTKYCISKKRYALLELRYAPLRHWVGAENNWIPPYVGVFDPMPGTITRKWKGLVSGYALFEAL